MSQAGTHEVNERADVHSKADSDDELYTVRMVSRLQLKPEQTVTLKISPKHYIKFQIDTGADCNVIPVHVYIAATGDSQLQKVQQSTKFLYGYGQKSTPSVGQVKIKVLWGESSCDLDCEFLRGKQYNSMLGHKASVQLDLIERKDNDMLNPLRHCTSQVCAAQMLHNVDTKDINTTIPKSLQ